MEMSDKIGEFLASEALLLVNGDRQKDYGNPKDSFNRIAGLWSAYLGCHVSAKDVARMMTLLKISRLKSTPDHEDSMIDAIGYII